MQLYIKIGNTILFSVDYFNVDKYGIILHTAGAKWTQMFNAFNFD